MLNKVELNLFESVKQPQVSNSLRLKNILERIKTGGPKKKLIEYARQELNTNNKEEYNKIKLLLPCVNWNCLFDKYRNNNNIICWTGLIALEVDGDTSLPQHDLIFVSYRTLSNNGRAFLVRVENINKKNFKYNYKLISNEIGLNADLNAAKATQPFILPFDSDIFLNTNAEVWKGQNEKKAHYVPQKKEQGIGTVMGPYDGKRRFSNIGESINKIDFNGEAVWDIGQKIDFASMLIPRNRINEGNRNTTLFSLGCQFRALNPSINSSDVSNLLSSINNKHCSPRISTKELKRIVHSIMKIEVSDLELNLNDSRRFLFNPAYDLTSTEKRSLVMSRLNEAKKEKSKKEIENTILNWDFQDNGKITQKKLAKEAGKNIKTVKKYYGEFKSQIQLLNKEFGQNRNRSP